MDGSRRLAYTEGRSVHHTAVPLTCSTFSRPLVHGVVCADAASPIGSACTLRFRRRSGRARRPSESGGFWPYMPLHPLQNMALNAYFSLFEIWPRFRPPQAHFASCFGPCLCKCTILEQVPCFALLYVSVLCIFRISCLVKVCSFAQTLTRPCRPLNLPVTPHSRRPVGNADTALPGAVCRPCHRGVGRCMGVGRPGVRL